MPKFILKTVLLREDEDGYIIHMDEIEIGQTEDFDRALSALIKSACKFDENLKETDDELQPDSKTT